MTILRLFFILILAGTISCTNKQKEEASATENAIPLELKPTAEKKPIMRFDQPLVYLGKIKQGDKVSYTYHFKNKGNLPLKIVTVNASCGCTTPKWSQNLIQPGKKGFIKVTFDSNGKEGKLLKTITAYCNTIPMDNSVGFKIEVLVPKK
ncbi:MAG: DUF1573 domain-containing protein [Aquirufa sp.]